MSVNHYDKSTGTLTTLANGNRVWIGTKAAHAAAILNNTMPNNCIVYITDDYDPVSGGTSVSNDFNPDDFSVTSNVVSLTPKSRVFTGTSDEWNQLTTAEKLEYGVAITNDSDTNELAYFEEALVGDIKASTLSTPPAGWYLCNGQQLNTADEPLLFQKIGHLYDLAGDSDPTKFRVPDYRESVLVGAGENTTQTIASHDVYTLGEFKDDQFQGHSHYSGHQDKSSTSGSYNYLKWDGNYDNPTKNIISDGTNGTPRTGSTTHGKQTGVNYFIKAKITKLPLGLLESIKQGADTTPTANSDNLITSGGVKNAINIAMNKIRTGRVTFPSIESGTHYGFVNVTFPAFEDTNYSISVVTAPFPYYAEVFRACTNKQTNSFDIEEYANDSSNIRQSHTIDWIAIHD